MRNECQPRTLSDPDRLAHHGFFCWIKGDPLEISATDRVHICQAAPVARKTHLRYVRRWCGDCFWRSQHFPRCLFDWHTPEIHAARPVAYEIKIISVRRPHRTPIHRGVVCHLDGLASISRNGPDVSLGQSSPTLIGDPISVG